MKPGPLNLVTDVTGVRVGHAGSDRHKTGVSVVAIERPNRAAVHVAGGAPGTRETDALAAHNIVEGVDAIVLSGGSAFGLDAAGTVQIGLARTGRGFEVLGHRVPIVPAAILFDLANGGEPWDESPYPALGAEALRAVRTRVAIGSVGAGLGAVTGGWNGSERFGLKGGIGSASSVLNSGITVGALIAINALGSPCDRDGRFLAAPFERDEEFGGFGASSRTLSGPLPVKGRETGASTTIGVVATDAALSKAQCQRLAIAAHDGLARALWPSHTPLDGDLVFAVSTGVGPEPDVGEQIELAAAAAAATARAIARGVFAARPAAGDTVPTWHGLFG